MTAATPDPRDALADQLAAELAASDKAHAQRAAATARLGDHLRKFGTGLAVMVGVLALSAGPADAMPVHDDLTYRTSCTVTLTWPISQQICWAVPR